MPNIPKIQFEILLNEKGLVDGIKKAEKQVDSFKEKNKSLFKTIKAKWLEIVGVFYSVKKAFDFTREFQEYQQSLQALTRQTGQSATKIVQELRKVSAGTISNKNLVLAANRAVALGVTKNVKVMARLLEIARLRARAMGISTTQAFNDIVTGIGRASPLILDNLGFITKGWAEEAKAAGKAYDAQFILNKILEQGSEELKRAGGLTLTTAEKMAKLGASWENFRITLGRLLTPILVPIIEKLSKIFDVISKAPQPILAMARTLIFAATAFKILNIAIKALNLNPVVLGLTLVITAVSGIISKIKSARKETRLLYGEITEADRASLEQLKRTQEERLKRKEKEIDKIKEEIRKLRERDVVLQSELETRRKQMESLDEASRIYQKEHGQLEVSNKKWNELQERLKEAQTEYNRIREKVISADVQLKKLDERLKTKFKTDIKIETNVEKAKAEIEDYYSYLEMQRELALLKEKERFEKALNAAIQFHKDREEIETLHQDNIQFIKDSYAMTEDERRELSKIKLLEFFAWVEEQYGVHYSVLTKQNREAALRRYKIEKDLNDSILKTATDSYSKIVEAYADGITSMLFEGERFRKSFKDFIKDVMISLGKLITKLLIMKGIMAATGIVFGEGGRVKSPFGIFQEGGLLSGPSHSQGGIPIEAEGGEYIVRKESVTSQTLPILETINRSFGRINSLIKPQIPIFQGGGIVNNDRSNRLYINEVIVETSEPIDFFEQLNELAQSSGSRILRR